METIQAQYAVIPPEDVVEKTAMALEANNFHSIIVNTKEEALAKIKELIPVGSSITNGASQTLEQIGYIEYLKKGKHGWDNLQAKVVAETDPVKQSRLRKEATMADYYLGSVHALSQTGEIVIASATGSQMPSIVFNSNNLIFVVSTQKITKNLDGAIKRLETYVVPLENARMQSAMGKDTVLAKVLVLHKESTMMGRNVTVLFVKEKLGF